VASFDLTLQTLPVMKTVFSLCTFSLQGKTCFHYRFFPVKKNYAMQTLPVFITGIGLQRSDLKKSCFFPKLHQNLLFSDKEAMA
jgi:hypothetical protein